MEDLLTTSFINFGKKLTHLYLRGIFVPTSLEDLETHTPHLLHLRVDWLPGLFPQIPAHRELRTIYLYDREWLTPWKHPSSHHSVDATYQIRKKWPKLQEIRDMTDMYVLSSPGKVPQWQVDEILTLRSVGISVLDRKGVSVTLRETKQGDLVE